MRIPHSIQGMLFAPALIALLFLLKAFCPASAGNACFADYFATPVFLPLVALYKIFGYAPQASYQELAFIFLYWALVGFLLGLVADLLFHKKEAPLYGAVDLVSAQGSYPGRPSVAPVVKPLTPPRTAFSAPPPVSAQPKAGVSAPAGKPPINLLERAEYR